MYFLILIIWISTFTKLYLQKTAEIISNVLIRVQGDDGRGQDQRGRNEQTMIHLGNVYLEVFTGEYVAQVYR